MAVVRRGLAQIIDEPEARIRLADERRLAADGDVAALNGYLDFSSVESVTMEVGPR